VSPEFPGISRVFKMDALCFLIPFLIQHPLNDLSLSIEKGAITREVRNEKGAVEWTYDDPYSIRVILSNRSKKAITLTSNHQFEYQLDFVIRRDKSIINAQNYNRSMWAFKPARITIPPSGRHIIEFSLSEVVDEKQKKPGPLMVIGFFEYQGMEIMSRPFILKIPEPSKPAGSR
jgi:hypothetical protein